MQGVDMGFLDKAKDLAAKAEGALGSLDGANPAKQAETLQRQLGALLFDREQGRAAPNFDAEYHRLIGELRTLESQAGGRLPAAAGVAPPPPGMAAQMAAPPPPGAVAAATPAVPGSAPPAAPPSPGSVAPPPPAPSQAPPPPAPPAPAPPAPPTGGAVPPPPPPGTVGS